MNQNYTSNGLNNPTYIPNQSTYPPYMNIPGYSNLICVLVPLLLLLLLLFKLEYPGIFIYGG